MRTPTTARPAVQDVTGTWVRRLLERPDGSRDETTAVTWLQAQSLYVDLRTPGPGGDRADVEGFAGRLVRHEDHVEWQRLLDVRSTGGADAGRLSWQDGLLVEQGVHEAYVEHWQPVDERPPRCAGVLLRADDGDCAVLVRTGRHVGWACGPRTPDGTTVVSVGQVGSGPAVLERSTSALRVGTAIGIRVDGRRARTRDVLADGTVLSRCWQVLALEGRATDLPALGADVRQGRIA